MSQPLLSILIPTVFGREADLDRLVKCILKDDSDMFYEYGEILTHVDNKEMTIGKKRERLYQRALGKYSWQIDDDDSIADNAIELIIEAIKQEPDCVTFREKCMINGKYYSSNHSLKYTKWADNQDGFDYVRSPFYKDVIKTEIAQKVPFEHIRWNEDERFSYALLPHLKNEVHIYDELYYYIHNSTDPTERYGLDRDIQTDNH